MRIGWKLALVGLMLLLLLIPLGLLDSLVAERQARGQEVADGDRPVLVGAAAGGGAAAAGGGPEAHRAPPGGDRRRA